MTGTYATGILVAYDRELPCQRAAGNDCSEAVHYGTVLASTPDVNGDQVVTVRFDCGLTQDILGSDLHLVADD